MQKHKVGVVGCGYVGTAVSTGLQNVAEVREHDKYIDTARLHSVITNSDIIFLCLPTPMKEDGSCDISIIEEVSKYPNALDAIREYIANAWDADADKLEITIDDNLIKIEDWGTGISNFKVFWGVADQHKSAIEFTTKYGRKPIGRKGLGKLSFAMLGNNISVDLAI